MCRSTGKHYALKLQSKNGLIKVFKSALHRIDFEKQALVSCNHPFIVRLDYAFQTSSLVLLAMELGTGKQQHVGLLSTIVVYA